MGDRKIPHVEDIFTPGGGPAQNRNSTPDHKPGLSMFKNKPAPAPPGAKFGNMPKIGNYQPKILLQPLSKAQPHNLQSLQERDSKGHEERSNVSSSDKVIGSSPPRAMIIGDKNVPLRLERSPVDDIDTEPVAPPRRKRRAPSAPDEREFETPGNTNNPLFSRSMSQRSDEEVFDMEEQGGDIDFTGGLDNPAYNARSRTISASSYQNRTDFRSSRDGVHSESGNDGMGNSQIAHVQVHREDSRRRGSDNFAREKLPEDVTNGTKYPYIPPPDYYDEEVTMDFDEERDKFFGDALRQMRPKGDTRMAAGPLEGDDFGRYLEENYEFDRPVRPPPGAYRKHGTARSAPPRERPKQPKWEGRDKKDKKKKAKEQNKRNTIRDFTFSDSKIGWGDRTVKSTSAKGRYIKREKERNRIDTKGVAVGPGSYEEFLNVRNGIVPESPNSSDSGVELGDDRPPVDMYLKAQPKHMRHHRPHDDKPHGMWQRLTWRFRKSVNVTRHEPPREREILYSERL